MRAKILTAGFSAITALTLTNLLGLAPANAFDDHKSITLEGLTGSGQQQSFLNPWIIEDTNDEHAWMDKSGSILDPFGNVTDDYRHFDDCDFDGSVGFINSRYKDAQNALTQRNFQKFNDEFGQALHPVQDFYSHSNWVELGFPNSSGGSPNQPRATQKDLVDISGAQKPLGSPWFTPRDGGAVRGDILLANDSWNIDPGWSIVKRGAGPFQSTLIDPNKKVRGRLLESGRGSRDDGCEVNIKGNPIVDVYEGFTHDQLAKDSPGSSAESRLKFAKARALAVRQTGYEWCRVVAEAGKSDRDGFLLAMVVRPGGDPHPVDTPCAPSPRPLQGPAWIPVSVSIESVKIKDSGDSGSDPGEIQLSAVFYDSPSNFHQSVHKRNIGGAMELKAGQFVPTAKLPTPLAMCVRLGNPVNFAVHGWENDDGPSDVYRNEYDANGDADEVLVGARARLSGAPLSGVQTLEAEDLQIKYRVSRTSSSVCRS